MFFENRRLNFPEMTQKVDTKDRHMRIRGGPLEKLCGGGGGGAGGQKQK